MIWFIYALVAAILFGFKQILAKQSLEKAHAAEHLSAFTIVAFILSWTFLPKIHLFSYGADVLGLMYIKALVLTFSWLFAIKALRHMEISFVIPMLTMSPLVLLVIGIIFLGEVPTLVQYMGVFLLLMGAYWLQADHSKEKLLKPWKTFKNKYALYMLVPIIGYSVCAALDKVILQKADPYTFLFFTFGILSIHYFLIQTYRYKGVQDIRHAFKKSSHVIVLGAVFAFLSDIIYYF
ncbi:TPA: EamA family transporter, partial [Candidatus Woesearchaeota archaeon]|nr:EamA family transporter [Candidatus Woesearchaeota archaeon]